MISRLICNISAIKGKQARAFVHAMDMKDCQLIAGNKHAAMLKFYADKLDVIEKVKKVFRDRHVDLLSASGQKLALEDMKNFERGEVEVLIRCSKPDAIGAVEDKLRGMNVGFNLKSPKIMPWFPLEEADLNLMGSKMLKTEEVLNRDHPEYTDFEYRERRKIIAANNIGVRMSDPIPEVNYSAEEHQLWGKIYKDVKPLHQELGCTEYNNAIENLEKEGLFSPNKIPQLEDLSKYLKTTTNWRLKPVNGILSQREFLNALAFRTFCCTQYIRHPAFPEYTPEPDIMHEFLGHIPTFADPKICEISQKLGILSLGAIDDEVRKIGSIYFYTIEFGLCREYGAIKFYGAGPGGSRREMLYLKDTIKNRRDKIIDLDIINNELPSTIIVQDLQPYFYLAESFDSFLIQLENYSHGVHRPFNLEYNKEKNSFEPDRALLRESYQSEE